jgi:DNA primase
VQVNELKRYIFENKKITFVLEQLGCQYIKYNHNKNYYSCSNPDGDNKAAVTISNDKYLNCRNFTRNLNNDNADLITLAQFYQKVDFRSTIKHLHKVLGLELSYFTKPIQKAELKKNPLDIFTRVLKRRPRTNVLTFDILSENAFYDFVPYIHMNFFREGVIKRTIDKFGLAYSYRYQRTVIPMRYWATGELLGFNMRSSIDNCELLDIKKYYLTPNYPKSFNLFGLWENYEGIIESGYIVIVESEKYVLKRHSRLDETCVALSGHTMSDEQVRIILGLDVKEIVISLDNDLTVQDCRHLCEKFYGIRIVSYIHDRWNLLPQKSNASDVGNKIYQFLFKHRVRYDEKERKEYLKGMGVKK